MTEDSTGKTPQMAERRMFLVVVDESEELHVALRFACRRAQRTGGRVALLYVMEPSDFAHWMAVKKVMEEEQRTAAEERLQSLSTMVMDWTGEMPVLFIREGSRRDELLSLMDEEPSISILVLGAARTPGGPGPLISALTGKYSEQLHVPLTIVPGTLSEEEIDALT
ncbi:MAG: universal stress protein [Proteobacteria bacterium]|nr:universal stress protein [Pseudomonadota bacterium]